MKLGIRDSKPDKYVNLYLEVSTDGVKVMADNGDGGRWNLLKVTPEGIMLASSVPSVLGFPLGLRGTLVVSERTY